MSDTSQGPGWWMASDGKWYPPELWTGPPSSRPTGTPQPSSPAQPTYPAQGPSAVPGSGGSVPPTQPPQGTTPYGATPYGGAPSYGATPYGGAPAYGATPYSATPYAPGAPTYAPYGQAGQAKTNGLSIAALVCGCVGFLFFIPAVLGVIFGFVARSQIKKSGGTQKGEGMAIAGIILGFAWFALLIVLIAFGNHNNNTNGVVNPAGFPLQLLLGGGF